MVQVGDAKARHASRWRIRAQLLGGSAGGLTIELEDLPARISVYRNGGGPVAVAGDPDASPHPGHVLLGVYDLVGPVGPETPVYVALAS